MADKYWYGGGSGHENECDWDDSGGGATSNWHLCSDDTPCAKPTDQDVVFFDGRAQLDSGTGSPYDCVENCAMNVNLNGLYVKSNFSGDIGADDDPLVFSINATVGTTGNFIYEGTGTMYASIETGANNETVDFTVVNAPSGALYLDCEQNGATYTGQYTVVHMIAGNCFAHKDAGEGAYIKDVYMSGGTLTGDNDAYKQADNTMTEFKILSGGTVYWDAGHGDIIQTGGTFNWGTANAAPASGDPITGGVLYQYGGGTYNWTSAAHAGGAPATLQEFHMYGASCILDASLALNANYRKQLGTDASAEEDSVLWYGTVRLNNPSENLEFASLTSIENHGGTIVPPDNADMSF